MSENSNFLNEEMDPNKWTVKDIVRNNYREIKLLREAVEAKDLELDQRVASLETWKSAQIAVFKFIVAIGAVAGAIYGVLQLIEEIP